MYFPLCNLPNKNSDSSHQTKLANCVRLLNPSPSRFFAFGKSSHPFLPRPFDSLLLLPYRRRESPNPNFSPPLPFLSPATALMPAKKGDFFAEKKKGLFRDNKVCLSSLARRSARPAVGDRHSVIRYGGVHIKMQWQNQRCSQRFRIAG